MSKFASAKCVVVSLLAGVCLSLFIPALTYAQAGSTGTVSGQVTDQSDAVVAGAEITLTDVSTNTSRSTSTNDAGRYIFVNISPGVYDLTAAKPGFRVSRFSGQTVNIGTTLTLNVKLDLGATSETVEVTYTAGAELQTTNASVGTSISGDALQFLPNLGRDVSTLAVLQPGTTPQGFTAGAYADQNTYTLDGGNNSDDMSGNYTSYTTNFTGSGGTQTNGNSSGVLPTPVESIEEFKVASFNQPADFNGSIGGQIVLVTKRGTNQWHGSGYEYYFASNIGAANSWDNNHTPARDITGKKISDTTPLPSNHRNRFGGTLGGPITPKIWGGKTYFFVNYEGFRFPNVATYRRAVPSNLMRAGVVQVPNGLGKPPLAYNLNPVPVTVDGVTYQPAACPGGPCDPRNLGLNPVIRQIWNMMPLANDANCSGLTPARCDKLNSQAFISTLRAPLTSNSYVARIDHDFGSKWHFMSSYRFLRLDNLTNNQVDIGGALPGDILGQPKAKAARNQVPGYFVAGITTNISSNVTNNFVYNYTRNFWQWGSANAPAQLPGLGGAVEIAAPGNSAAETANSLDNLIPYNVNTQSIRQRFWDGKDQLFRDDLTMIKSNHLLQFGGLYQRNFDYHSRTDNGQGINNQIVYQIASAGINFPDSYIPPAVIAAKETNKYKNVYTDILGLVGQSQVAYTRSGSNLTLEPIGRQAFDKSVIPTYSVYFSDSWHWKPSFTLTYGLGYTLEMPPFEKDGKQVELVGPDGTLIDTRDYLARRKEAALSGGVYNPTLGFAIMPNIGKGLKYPYNPFYGGFSPRIAAAWSPRYDSGLLGKFLGTRKTVIRGGYGRIFGRLNGVNLVLVPLLGPGLLQSVSCTPDRTNRQCGNFNPSDVFRIGTDGMTALIPPPSQTLPQPFYPGVGGNIPAGDSTVLDPNYRPERTDNFTLTIQRELSSKMTLEVGYLGRIIANEFQEINLDAVPYMTTLGGQTFAKAFANTYIALCGLGPQCPPAAERGAVPTQPWFETALSGAGSTYCTTNAKGVPVNYGSCTAAVVAKEGTSIANTAVSELWRSLNSSPSWKLGRTMISSPGAGGVPTNPNQGTSINTTTSFGYGNYNALFVTLRARDFHGLTALSNFTWGRALGTGTLGQSNSGNTALDPWNMRANYGPNNFDIRFIYNLALFYQPPYFRNQHGVLGRILGGWTISPLFTAQSGAGASPSYSEGGCVGCQAFGEVTPPAGSSSSAENAVFAAPYTGGNSAHYNVHGSGNIGTNNDNGLNIFADPASVYKQFRPCILGYDTNCGGYYNIRALPLWNLDATVAKDIPLSAERLRLSISFQFTNVLNHFQPGTAADVTRPNLRLTDPGAFGSFTTQANTPRNMEFGLRLHF